MKIRTFVLTAVVLIGFGVLFFYLVTIHYRSQREHRNNVNTLSNILAIISDYRDAVKSYDETNSRSLRAIKDNSFDKSVQDFISGYAYSRELLNKAKTDIGYIASKDEVVSRITDRLKFASGELLTASDILTKWLIAYSQQDYASSKLLSPKEAHAKRTVCDRYLQEALDLVGTLFNKHHIEDEDLKYKYAHIVMSDVTNSALIERIHSLLNIEQPDAPLPLLADGTSKWGMLHIDLLPRNIIEQAALDVMRDSPALFNDYIAVLFPKDLSDPIKAEVISYVNGFRGPLKATTPLLKCSPLTESCVRVHILVNSGVNLEREILLRGWAMVIDDVDYDGKQELLDAQREAKEKELGIWSPQYSERKQPELKIAKRNKPQKKNRILSRPPIVPHSEKKCIWDPNTLQKTCNY